ncbi:unnamed protein product [Lactuca virosa]|uniref:Uncharacterized protein n=1 Tax=Lactuca virosa TaxID=75947 RepID=A0AAU9P7Z6_9ASTR|nr:unnamed protein product [Lactuca virosa]
MKVQQRRLSGGRVERYWVVEMRLPEEHGWLVRGEEECHSLLTSWSFTLARKPKLEETFHFVSWSNKSPEEFAKELVKEVHEYNGFNLITLDLSSNTMFYISNRPKSEPPTVQQVQPGIHVLSNAKLDSSWPKAQRLKFNFKKLLSAYDKDEDIPMKDMMDKLMRDTMKAEKSQLPNICSIDWEHNLSSIFVEVDTPLGRYGTRSMIALSIKDTEEASFHETYIERGFWWEKTVDYYVTPQVKTKDIVF